MNGFFDNFHAVAWCSQLLVLFFCVPLVVYYLSFGPPRWKRNALYALLATVWLWSPWAIYGSYRAYMAVHNVSITALRSLAGPSTPEHPL